MWCIKATINILNNKLQQISFKKIVNKSKGLQNDLQLFYKVISLDPICVFWPNNGKDWNNILGRGGFKWHKQTHIIFI